MDAVLPFALLGGAEAAGGVAVTFAAAVSSGLRLNLFLSLSLRLIDLIMVAIGSVWVGGEQHEADKTEQEMDNGETIQVHQRDQHVLGGPPNRNKKLT